MRISFSGLESPIAIMDKGITILQIKNNSLFARICQSLLSLKGEDAVEQYSVWDKEGREIAPAKAFIIVSNPFDLPWKHKDLMGSLYERFEHELLLDEELRQEIQDMSVSLESSVQKIGFQLNADYRFALKWNISNYLKAFSYGVEISDSTSLFDNLISFIDFGADMSIDKVILFINLKTFLTKNELMMLQERLIFHGISAFLLENYDSPFYLDCEKKYIVDQDFVEYVFENKSECTSSTQGGICSIGFGAVTF